MKTPIHILLVQLVAVSLLPGCTEVRATQPAPPTKATNAKPIIPQTTVQPASPSEVLPALDAPAAKAAFAAVASKRRGDKAESASAEFGHLLRQWNPQGKTVQEVKIIIGPPDWEKDGAFGYRFDSGWGGWEWSLSSDGKAVIDVKRTGIN